MHVCVVYLPKYIYLRLLSGTESFGGHSIESVFSAVREHFVSVFLHGLGFLSSDPAVVGGWPLVSVRS